MKNNKYKRQLFVLVTLILIASSLIFSQDNQEFPVLKGKYLGQKPPGLKPEVFAPGIISGKYSFHGFLTFSPDGKEIYWPVILPQIMYVKYENRMYGCFWATVNH